MSQLFDSILDLTQHRFRTNTPTTQQWAWSIEKLKNRKIRITQDEDVLEIVVDWRSATFGGYSSGKGIKVLTDKLKKMPKQAKDELLSISMVEPALA